MQLKTKAAFIYREKKMEQKVLTFNVYLYNNENIFTILF